MLNKINNRKGFTLIEILVVIFIFSAGILTVYRVIPGIVNITTINSSRVTATYLAQEGIEIVKNVRDGNWLQGAAWNADFSPCLVPNSCEFDYDCASSTTPGEGTNPCFKAYSSSHYLKNNNTTGFFNYNSGIVTKFKRKITIDEDNPPDDDATVTVDVFWSEKGKSYNISVQEKVYNWNQ